MAAKRKKELSWDEIGKAIGQKIEKNKWEDCEPVHKWTKHKEHSGGFAYLLGFLGALVYYITTATSITGAVIGFFKAILWPAFLVFGAMSFMGL
jgi:hypothetical protein